MSDNSIERLCGIFGYLDRLQQLGTELVSSIELGKAVGATAYTVRKDISLLGITGYTRRGYQVSSLKKAIGAALGLDKKRKACIAGLGRLGTALLDYEKFQEDGFEIVAGFESSVNKLERIRTSIPVYPVSRMREIIGAKNIELGIITVPAESAQDVAGELVSSGIKGIMNFTHAKLDLPEEVIQLNLDFTDSLRFIAARLGENPGGETENGREG